MSSHDYSAAQVIAGGIHASEQARLLFRPDMSPRQYLDALRDAGCHADVLKFLPHVLDKPRAIWWGCLCCFEAYQDRMTPALARSLTDALGWLQDPNEAKRRVCLGGTAEPKLNSAENCLRMAVYWCGGSMVPPHLPEVLPPPDLTAQLCTAAVLIAAASRGMFEIAGRHALYVNLGYEVLDGRLLWSASTAMAPQDVMPLGA